MAKRIQRKRTKGWRMPAGAKYVGRPGPWGNPFETADEFLAWLNFGLGYWNGDRRMWILNHIRELRGLDLACWCPLDKPCHADVLLEMANQEDAA